MNHKIDAENLSSLDSMYQPLMPRAPPASCGRTGLNSPPRHPPYGESSYYSTREHNHNAQEKSENLHAWSGMHSVEFGQKQHGYNPANLHEHHQHPNAEHAHHNRDFNLDKYYKNQGYNEHTAFFDEPNLEQNIAPQYELPERELNPPVPDLMPSDVYYSPNPVFRNEATINPEYKSRGCGNKQTMQNMIEGMYGDYDDSCGNQIPSYVWLIILLGILYFGYNHLSKTNQLTF